MTAVSDMVLSDEACTRIEDRLGRLREAMRDQGVQSILVSDPQDVRYLADCFGHDTRILVTPSQAVLISDRRYEEYLAPWADSGRFRVAIENRSGQIRSIGETLASEDVTTLGVQASVTTLAAADGLKASLKGVEIEPVTGMLARLRMRKSPCEIAAIEAAIEVQCVALDDMLSALRLGMQEQVCASHLIHGMRCHGAESEAFEPIVGSGANASVIHHVPGKHPVSPGVLLVDWGARVNGLCSDLTRTFFLGPPDAELENAYHVVAKAQQAAIAACVPGAMSNTVDAAARAVIDEAGLGDRFAHGIGHGLGRDVHEQPFMGREGVQTPLEPGMVVTIEPGVYLPGVGGVRIEDDILITDAAPRVLSAALDSSFEGACRPIPPQG